VGKEGLGSCSSRNRGIAATGLWKPNVLTKRAKLRSRVCSRLVACKAGHPVDWNDLEQPGRGAVGHAPRAVDDGSH
jgi:hypothetical protein